MKLQSIRKLMHRVISRHRQAVPFKALARLCKYYLDCWENANYEFSSNGEEDVLKKLSKLDFKCIFDVGAHVGRWTLLARNYFPKAQIYCFEILDPLYLQLQKVVKDTPRITANPFGLLNETTEVKVNYYPEAMGNSGLYSYPVNGECVTLKGEVVVGDEYMKEMDIKHIDFLKVDVEGAEHLVLEGLTSALKEGRIDIIQFEYGRVNILSGFLLKDFYEFLTSYGYRVGKIYPNYVEFRDYELQDEDFRGPNFLAVREEKTDIIEMLK